MGFRQVDRKQSPDQRQKRTKCLRRLIGMGKDVRESLRFAPTGTGRYLTLGAMPNA